MRGFLIGIVLCVVAGGAIAALVELAPVAPVRVAGTLALAGSVYFAARAGSPGFPVIGHLFGAAFAILAFCSNWLAWFAVIADFDWREAANAAQLAPAALLDRLYDLSESRGVPVGGRVIDGAGLRAFWLLQAVLVGLAGLFGGQSAREIRRDRKRAEQARV